MRTISAKRRCCIREHWQGSRGLRANLSLPPHRVPAVCTPDGANETGASPVGARVEDTLEKQLVNAKCVRVVMAQVTVCSLPAGPWARVEGRCE